MVVTLVMKELSEESSWRKACFSGDSPAATVANVPTR